MIFKILFVLFLVAANGFFVAAEFALVKIRLGEIRTRAREGGRSARTVLHIVEHLDAYLSACQLGITLASLGLGWVGEPMVAKSIQPLLDRFHIDPHNAHYVSFPLAFGLITFLHITAGEQVPKMLAIQRYRATSQFTAIPLVVFYRILKPFIWVLNSSSNLMLKAVGIKSSSEHASATEEELRMILLETSQGGSVSLRERLMMENILDLESRTARAAMLPRNQIVFIDREDPIEKQMETLTKSGHTRLPICEGDLDHVSGIIHVKDILRRVTASGPPTDLMEFARPAVFLLETMTLDRVLRELQRTRTILALLADEFGVVSGMITLENVLEEVVGPIRDEFDTDSPRFREVGKDTYDVDATFPVSRISRELGLKLPEEKADTIGGLLAELMGRIPQAGDSVLIGPYKFTVTAAEPTCARTLSVERTGSRPPDSDAAHPPAQ